MDQKKKTHIHISQPSHIMQNSDMNSWLLWRILNYITHKQLKTLQYLEKDEIEGFVCCSCSKITYF